MKRMTFFARANLVHHGLDALLELAAVLRARDHEGEVERDDLLVAQNLRHVARWRFPARGPSTMAVLPTPASPISTGLFLVRRQRIWMTRSISFFAPDDRDRARPSCASSVRSRPNARSAGVFDFLLVRSPRFADAPSCSGFRRGEIRIEFLENLVAGALDVDVEGLQHARGHAFAFAQQAEQDVLGADVGMIERLRLLAREREHFLHARRVGNVADHLRLRAGADLLLHLHAHGLEVEPHLLQHVDGDALAELDQPEQQMLGARHNCG